MTSAVVESPHGVGDSLRAAMVLGGILAFTAGLLILLWPDKTAMAVTAIIGVYLIVVGLSYVVSSFGSRTRSAWGRIGHLLLGVLYIAAGVFGLTNLSAATETLATFLAILVGALWVVEGFFALTTIGMMQGSKGWTILFALLTIGAGIVVLLSPMWAAATLWWILGLALVVLGVVQIGRAIAWKVPAPPAHTFGPPTPFPR